MQSGRFGSERGAILIQTTLASVVLLGFMAFVTDYGIYWVSRGQAQAAADAGALAGAVSLAYDEPVLPAPNPGVATQMARAVALKNQVWSGQPGATVTFNCPADIGAADCVNVTVYRDGTNGSETLPFWFAPALGISASQGLTATATAQLTNANRTDCLRPWALPDKWTEVVAPPNQFSAYQEGAPIGTALPNPDVYVAPSNGGTGTGLTTADDRSVTITFDQYIGPGTGYPIGGHYQPLDLTPGGRTYLENVASCNGSLIAIGQHVKISQAVDARADFTTDTMVDVVDEDPGAMWNPVSKHVEGGCAPECGPVSPRLVVVALYDTDEYERMRAANDWSSCDDGVPCVRIVNLVGFFINVVAPGASGSADGFFTVHPGQLSSGNPTLTTDSSFLKSIALVR